MKLIRWTEEQKALFDQYASRYTNQQLEEIIGMPAKNIGYRRGTLKAVRDRGREKKYSEDFKEYVKTHYRTSTDKEIRAELQRQYPVVELTENSIRMLRQRLKLHRTKAEDQALLQRLLDTGVIGHASRVLSDNYVVSRICFGNLDNKELVLKTPELIAFWRQELLDRRELKEIIKELKNGTT